MSKFKTVRTTRTISPKQIQLIATLLRKSDMWDSKKQVVKMYSRNQTESLRELTNGEANDLIQHLNSLLSQPGVEKLNRMRHKIFAIAREMHWVRNSKPDYERINNWCVKYGFLHKPLNEYKEKELPTLVSQFEEVYKCYLKELNN